MGIKEELISVWDLLSEIRESIKIIKKHKFNTYYKKPYEEQIKELNRQIIFLKIKIEKIDKDSLSQKFNKITDSLHEIIGGKDYDLKTEEINKLEMFWPQLEVEFENFNIKSFEIPEEIPLNESRLDLEEAIKDYDSGCYISCLVLCRRSYEGALVESYQAKEKKNPEEIKTCKNCKVQLGQGYLGIANLHRWAISKNLVNNKFQSAGYLVSDLGAGGAHPPLKDFPRDKEVAKVSITTLIALLKEIYKN